MMLEAFEFLLPVGAELGLHPAFDEGPAHWRRLALQLGELVDVFGRQRFRNGSEQLRHLHDRALEATERRSKFSCILGTIKIETKKPRACHPGRHATNIGADAGVARRASCEAVSFFISHLLPTRSSAYR
jgi:hypothetical protein